MNNEGPSVAIADLTPLWIRVLTPRIQAEYKFKGDEEGTTFALGALPFYGDEDKPIKYQRLTATATLTHNDGQVSIRITAGLVSGPLPPELVISDTDEGTRRMVERTASEMLYDHCRRTAFAAAALLGREVELPFRPPTPMWMRED